MAGILPSESSGGLVVRDQDGNCFTYENVSYAACPDPAFLATCDLTALPSGCGARITPAQINAMVSEMLNLGAMFSPTGVWRCSATDNLAQLFNTWVNSIDLCASPMVTADDIITFAPLMCDMNGELSRFDLDTRYLQLTGGTLTGDLTIEGATPSLHYFNPSTGVGWDIGATDTNFSVTPTGATESGFEFIRNGNEIQDIRFTASPAATVYDASSVLNVGRADARYQRKLPTGEGYLYNDGADNLSWSTPAGGGGGDTNLPPNAPGALTNNGSGGLSWVQYAPVTTIGDSDTVVGSEGQLLIDENTGLLYIWSGGGWVEAVSGFVKLTGDTMTGALRINATSGNSEIRFGAGDALISLVPAGNLAVRGADDVANHMYYSGLGGPDMAAGPGVILSRKMADNRYLQLTGGTLTGNLNTGTPLDITQQTGAYGVTLGSQSVNIQVDGANVPSFPIYRGFHGTYQIFRVEAGGAAFLNSETGARFDVNGGSASPGKISAWRASTGLQGVQLDGGDTSSVILRAITQQTGGKDFRFLNDADVDKPFLFICNGIEYLRLAANFADFYPAVRIRTGGTMHSHAAVIQNDGYQKLYRNSGNGNLSFVDYHSNANDGNRVATIQVNGNWVNLNNSYGGISDARRKENIVDARPQLDDILGLRVVNFNFLGHDDKQLGLVAQEVQKIKPGLVEEGDDGFLTLKYSVLVPILLKGLQELTEEVKDLKSRLMH